MSNFNPWRKVAIGWGLYGASLPFMVGVFDTKGTEQTVLLGCQLTLTVVSIGVFVSNILDCRREWKRW